MSDLRQFRVQGLGNGLGFEGLGCKGFSGSLVIFIIWIHKAPNSSPVMDCYCMGAAPTV